MNSFAATRHPVCDSVVSSTVRGNSAPLKAPWAARIAGTTHGQCDLGSKFAFKVPLSFTPSLAIRALAVQRLSELRGMLSHH